MNSGKPPPSPAARRLAGLAIALSLGAALASSLVAAFPGIIDENVYFIDYFDAIYRLRPALLKAFRWAAVGGAIGLAAVTVFAIRAFLPLAHFAGRWLSDADRLAAWISRDWRSESPLDRMLVWLALPATFVLGALARLAHIDREPLWDEAYTITYYASRNLATVISDYGLPNNHLLHSLLAYLVYQFSGNQMAWLRTPAWLFSVLAFPALWWFAWRVVGLRAAVVTVMLAAASPYLIDYSVQARGYPLILLFTLLAFSLATYLVEQRNLAAWTVFAISLVLGFWAIPVMLYPATMIGVWMLVSAPATRRWALIVELAFAAVAVSAATLVAYAPAIARFGFSQISGNRFVRPMRWESFVNGAPRFFGEMYHQWTHGVADLLVLLAALAIAIALTLRDDRGKRLRNAVFAGLGVTTVFVLAQRVIPYTRIFIYLFPLALMAAALGWTWMGEKLARLSRKVRWTAAAAPALLFAIWVVVPVHIGPFTDPPLSAQRLLDLRSATELINQQMGPNDIATSPEPYAALCTYHLWSLGRPRTSMPSFSIRRQPLAPTTAPVIYLIWPKQENYGFLERNPDLTAVDMLGPTWEGKLQAPEKVAEFVTATVFRCRRIEPAPSNSDDDP